MFAGVGRLEEHLFGPNAEAGVLIWDEVGSVADTPDHTQGPFECAVAGRQVSLQADAAIEMIER